MTTTRSTETTAPPVANNDLIYQLHDTPAFAPAIFAALQHVLASFVGIITPTLIVGGVLGLGAYVPYLVSMALFVSGLGTFIQAKRIGPVGSGLLCLQGTSFGFLSVILSAGFIVKGRGGSEEEILSTIFGVCFCAAFVEIAFSQFINKLRRVITPVVTGTIICLMGLSLIKVAMTDIAGGYGAADLGALHHLGLGGLVLVTIVILNRFPSQVVRLSAVIIGLVLGFSVAWFTGKVDFANMAQVPLISVPVPFKYGFNFDWVAFVPIAVIFLITPLETAGDLTANSIISKQPVKGPLYMRRIKSGVLADGCNSAMAAMFNSLPMTTFSQNNGVIQLTGVASRHVAFYIAAILVLLGLFPAVGAVLQLMPKPVLGGATLIMFGTVAVAGIKILTEAGLHRRNVLIVAISLGLGLGVAAVPEVLSQMPDALKNIFGSPITIGAFSAIVLNIFLPEEHLQLEENDYDPEAHLHTVLQNPQDDSATDAPNSGRNEFNVAPRTS
ncbi:MAG: nucleobase:cation symporter-2 family protein [Pseudomonas sp.]|uniref:nucleobase:cation symporter-2 family protein n=1 Tax=Pseudomonas sp. TaxID=306 RepID=UPI002723D64E|nr:nucleobase:cation symporter-2 family protein [Pseudomonas sp.]MDO9618070.1 nucleobase:cation symporter-2 family protein [Pseudomonas sp.]MDP2446989.1 nucleobase:cation symporter-2 family protein [Pseudomonas sp.]MDZ4332969.1 nucleobase:cation symporter-2 family protein [Pseudomonas sp.]